MTMLEQLSRCGRYGLHTMAITDLSRTAKRTLVPVQFVFPDGHILAMNKKNPANTKFSGILVWLELQLTSGRL